MELYKYAKSLIVTEKKKYYWTSGFLFFVKDKNVILDKAFIILGEIPPYYYTHYCNFSNWNTTTNKDLFYHGIEVNPEKVYLHLKRGKSYNSEWCRDPTYWNVFVSHPNDKVFKYISSQLENRVQVIDLRNEIPSSSNSNSFFSNLLFTSNTYNYSNITEIKHPLFSVTQYYGNGIDEVDQVLFSSLKVESL